MEKVDIVYSQEQLKAQAGAWRLLNYRIGSQMAQDTLICQMQGIPEKEELDETMVETLLRWILLENAESLDDSERAYSIKSAILENAKLQKGGN